MGDCRALFHMPVERAAEQLGVSRPTIARVLRAHGVPRWPYRSYAAELRKTQRRAQSDHRPPPNPPSLAQRAHSAPSAGPFAETLLAGNSTDSPGTGLTITRSSASRSLDDGFSVAQAGRNTRKRPGRRERKSLPGAHVKNSVTLQSNSSQQNPEFEVRAMTESNVTGKHGNAGKSPAYVNSRRYFRTRQDLGKSSRDGTSVGAQHFISEGGAQYCNQKVKSFEFLRYEGKSPTYMRLQQTARAKLDINNADVFPDALASVGNHSRNRSPFEQENSKVQKGESIEPNEQHKAHYTYRDDQYISKTRSSPATSSAVGLLVDGQSLAAKPKERGQVMHKVIPGMHSNNIDQCAKLAYHYNDRKTNQLDFDILDDEEIPLMRRDISRLGRDGQKEVHAGLDSPQDVHTKQNTVILARDTKQFCRNTKMKLPAPKSAVLPTSGMNGTKYTTVTKPDSRPTATSASVFDDKTILVSSPVMLPKISSDAKSNSAVQFMQEEAEKNSDTMLTVAFVESDDDINMGARAGNGEGPSFVFSDEIDEAIQEDRWAVLGIPQWAQNTSGEVTDGLDDLIEAYKEHENILGLGLGTVDDPISLLMQGNDTNRFSEQDLLKAIPDDEVSPRQVALNGETVELFSGVNRRQR